MRALEPSFDLPDRLPGEPAPWGYRGGMLAGMVFIYGLYLFLFALCSIPLCIVYAVFRLAYPRPPLLARWGQVARYLGWTWTEKPGSPGLSFVQRSWLTVRIVEKVLWFPAKGLAWLIDEAIFGDALDAVVVQRPLFEISAARSGSTQLARYLETDARLAAPSILQGLFPYRWLWVLCQSTIGRWVTRAEVTRWFERSLPQEFLERHEGDPFRTDTFDAVLFLHHLHAFGLFLGPERGAQEFNTSTPTPQWEEDFVDLLARIGQKVLLDRPGSRLFVKGHFLAAGDALTRRFPDARFLTLLRRPEARFASAVNYLRANPIDPILGPVPWPWVAGAVLRSERRYCAREMQWYSGMESSGRYVFRFDDYVHDLYGTLTQIYAQVLALPPPPSLPHNHTERRRTAYCLQRSLADVGIDPAELRAQLQDYDQWCVGSVSALE